MIVNVELHQRAKHQKIVDSYFRLRKRVFADQLGWSVPVVGDMEKDELDDAPCTYTLVLDPTGELMGGARLIPTTQTTLLELAFDGLVPPEISFKSPTIWESSRYCVDHDLSESRLSSGAKRATLAISIGNFDYAMKNGITHYIAVVEERLFAFSRNYNPGVQVLGERTIDGAKIVCALFTLNDETARAVDSLRKLVAA